MRKWKGICIGFRAERSNNVNMPVNAENKSGEGVSTERSEIIQELMEVEK